jgi:glycosyltransferase involved in cell wall biosynthesis
MIQKRKLSIIVPCFNSAATLKEAVESIYQQNLTIPFEVILVDDGSSDGTSDVLAQLKFQHSHIILYKHAQNLGGGAARNTGIGHAKGDLVFCLDSDNVLIANSLMPMISFLDKEKLDGVAFHKRQYFYGENKRIGSVHLNQLRKKPFEIDDLFNKTNLLLDNFIYTKAAFTLAGGYPTHHGFDTQGFEVRFLSQGLRVRACPESSIYHRQRAQQLSYFERVYERGEYSRNHFLIFEEIFHLFSEEIKLFLIQYDLSKNSNFENNILKSLLLLHQKNPTKFFIPQKKKYLRPGGRNIYIRDHAKSKKIGDNWSLAINQYYKKQFSSSLKTYLSLLSKDISTPTLYWNILRASTGLDKSVAGNQIEQHVSTIISNLQLPVQKSVLRESIVILIVKKIARQLNRGKK